MLRRAVGSGPATMMRRRWRGSEPTARERPKGRVLAIQRHQPILRYSQPNPEMVTADGWTVLGARYRTGLQGIKQSHHARRGDGADSSHQEAPFRVSTSTHATLTMESAVRDQLRTHSGRRDGSS